MCDFSGSEESKASSKLNSELSKAHEKDNKIIKLLLLGAGASGKSTIFKQMKIIHSEKGFTDQEKQDYKLLIHRNVYDVYKQLIEATLQFGYSFESKHADIIKLIQNKLDTFTQPPLTSDMERDLTSLYSDEGILKSYDRRSEFNLLDSADYFVKNLPRLCSDNYIPTTDDILHSRSKTVGIVEQKFTSDKQQILMVDVGGQRNERRKWIHAFDAVTAVIYVAALSEYDQCLEENNDVNRMMEALTLFQDVCNDRNFKKKTFVIFYNKDDVFRNKIKKVDLNVCFPDYSGGKDYEKALKFIKDQFDSKNESKKRKVYSYVTTATDTNLVKQVFTTTQVVILKEFLDDVQLM
jgi:GTPase SAR1 family protein